MLPTPPLYPQFPLSNSPTILPLFSETLPAPFSSELVRSCPFKIKPSKVPEAKPLISYNLWTKAELRAIVKDFPKVMEVPHRFDGEFNIAILTCQPGFSDLYHLVHMLVGEGQTQLWMKATN